MVIKLSKVIWNEKVMANEKVDNSFDSLDVDILIIGGGITGFSVAYFLKDYKGRIALIDRNDIGNGTTSKSSAKITYMQGIYHKLKRDKATLYLKSQLKGINLLTNIIESNNINCDLKEVSSILFTNNTSNKKIIDLEKEFLINNGVKVTDYRNKYGIMVNDTYVFNPVKYLLFLREYLDKYIDFVFNTTVYKVRKQNNYYLVETSRGVIKCTKIVYACSYPFFIYPLFVPLKTYVMREYLNASYMANDLDYSMINVDNELYSLRSFNKYYIYVSNKHKLTSLDYDNYYRRSKVDFLHYFGKWPEYSWINQDIFSYDNLALIGKISPSEYIGTAYGGWGIINATLAGKMISDLIIKGSCDYYDLFNPLRFNFLFIKGLVGDSLLYIKNFLILLFKKNNPLYIKIKGCIYGIYLDHYGIMHIVKLICPHMKCLLVFNSEEKTWDCPCHGSRFDINGKVLMGPAVKNIISK